MLKHYFLQERQRTARPIRLAGKLSLPQGVGEAKAYKTRAVGRGGQDESAGRRTDEWADRCTGTLDNNNATIMC